MAEVLALRDAVRESDPEFYSTLKRAIGTIQAALHVYAPSELAFSFNGGKDSTAVLHLLRAALALADEDKPLAAVRNVYFSTPDEFPEILQFIQVCNSTYGMKMVTEAAFPDGLEDTVKKYGTRAILLGTRSTDPHGGAYGSMALHSSRCRTVSLPIARRVVGSVHAVLPWVAESHAREPNSVLVVH